MLPFLDTFFGAAGAVAGPQSGMPADTIKIDTGPVGSGPMILAGGNSWILALGVVLVLALLLRSGRR